MNRMIRFFNKVQPLIYQQNCDLGWHDDPQRDCWQFADLMHSEVSEGVEGLRKNLMDDHLPSYPMVACELADTIIRILDYMALCGETTHRTLPIDDSNFQPMHKALCFVHVAISQAAMYATPNKEGDMQLWLPDLHIALHLCYYAARREDYPIEEVVEAKIAYNKTRKDHKKDERAKPGGKSW